MARVDWSEVDGVNPLEPGVYLVRVSRCEERSTRNGDPYFAIALEAVDFENRLLCFDNINLGGNGRRFGQGKLSALGFKDVPEIQAEELVGRQAYVAVEREEDTRGRMRLFVVPEWGYGARAGYWSESDGPPPDVSVTTSAHPPTEPESPPVPF